MISKHKGIGLTSSVVGHSVLSLSGCKDADGAQEKLTRKEAAQCLPGLLFVIQSCVLDLSLLLGFTAHITVFVKVWLTMGNKTELLVGCYSQNSCETQVKAVASLSFRKPRHVVLEYSELSAKSRNAMSVQFSSNGTKIFGLRRRLPPVLFSIESPTPVAQFDNHVSPHWT